MIPKLFFEPITKTVEDTSESLVKMSKGTTASFEDIRTYEFFGISNGPVKLFMIAPKALAKIKLKVKDDKYRMEWDEDFTDVESKMNLQNEMIWMKLPHRIKEIFTTMTFIVKKLNNMGLT